MRNSNYGSLTITIDNFSMHTKVHCVSSGHSQGVFFKFDWGAGNDFINSVCNALKPYEVK
ncbi:DUF6054 family protein [Niallia sp. 03133]|uniref:DUF6054 family protein n=1 Tax=Niallia sp. 03133 TaxID=3458060 RepID=UPI004044757F